MSHGQAVTVIVLLVINTLLTCGLFGAMLSRLKR
jgi:uncharacterized membrane protein